MNLALPPLTVTISRTADGQNEYMQIVSADQFSLNIVLISQKITIQDSRIITQATIDRRRPA